MAGTQALEDRTRLTLRAAEPRIPDGPHPTLLLPVCECQSWQKHLEKHLLFLFIMFICLFQRTLLAPLSAFSWTTAIASHLSGVPQRGQRTQRPPESLPSAGPAVPAAWEWGFRGPWGSVRARAGGRVKAVPGHSPNHLELICYLGEVR